MTDGVRLLTTGADPELTECHGRPEDHPSTICCALALDGPAAAPPG